MNNIDIAQKRIEEKSSFIAWLNSGVPARYRRKLETKQCFSPVRNYQAISDVAYTEIRDEQGSLIQKPCSTRTFTKKRENLAAAEKKVVSQARNKGRFASGFGGLAHVLGNGKEPCERCIRIINARALYIVHEAHPEMFTESSHKIVWLEMLQRANEHEQEKIGDTCSGDGLFLLQAQTPERGCTTIHDNHLIFYDEKSVNHGVSALINRANANLDLMEEYPCIRDIVRGFSEPSNYRISGIRNRFVARTSYEHTQNGKINQGTIIDIFSRQ